MINTILTKIFGSQHEREVKKLLPLVAAINEMEPQIKALSDAELRAKTAEFKTQLANGATLDDLLIPAFAVAREARLARGPHAAVRRPAAWAAWCSTAGASPR